MCARVATGGLNGVQDSEAADLEVVGTVCSVMGLEPSPRPITHHSANCTYNFKDLQDVLPVAIEDILPPSTIRKFSRSCFRFMDA